MNMTAIDCSMKIRFLTLSDNAEPAVIGELDDVVTVTVLLSRHYQLEQRRLTDNIINDQPTTEEPVTTMLTVNTQIALNK